MATDFITGLKLASSGVEWTTLERVKDTLVKVESRQIEPVPAAPQSAEGEAASDAAPVTPLADVVAANAKQFKGAVTLGLGTDQILMRVARLPAVPDDELAGMVMLQVDKLSPFPVESMVVSHEVVDRSKDSLLVLIAAARNDVVDATGVTLAAANVFPARVDANVLGWWQLLKDSGHIQKSGRQVIIILSDSAPDILVLQDGIPVAVRFLSEQGQLTDEEFAAEVAQELSGTLLSQEIEHGPCAHCTISLWHRGATPSGLADAIRSTCQCEVQVNSLSSLPPVSEGLARRGAAGGQLLDLTPAAWRSAEREKTFRTRMYLAAGIVAGIWAFAVIAFTGGFMYQQSKLAEMKAQADRSMGPAKEVLDMRRRVAIIKRYGDRTFSALECLREITGLLPDGVDLDSYDYKRTSSGPPTVTIYGKGATVEQVYEFKNSLDGSKLFTKGALKGPSLQNGRQAFTIDMKLPIGGEE